MTMKNHTKPANRPLNFNGNSPKFFHYNQNNSGGCFVQDNKRGLSHHVIIEAEDARQANEIAEGIGIYFDGCKDGHDCYCCGDRWYPASDKGNDVPRIYDVDVSSGEYKTTHVWRKDKIEGFIHYLNRSVVPVKGVQVPYESTR